MGREFLQGSGFLNILYIMPTEHGNHQCQFHVLLYPVMAHVEVLFKSQLKHWNSVCASSTYSSPLNGFRSSLEKVERPPFSVLWHLVFIHLFWHTTCKNLIGWGANVLLVSIVPKHGNKYSKCAYLKPVTLLIFSFSHDVIFLQWAQQQNVTLSLELNYLRKRICLEASLSRRTCLFAWKQI